ncbi:hypothetical protein [Leptospira santarosai]|uniref:hypothetical protein n=1 Tax=Leptospira santarosai TaxID=28183 RepID=UPI0002976665|nr:hypothetical protein [Leptospira santarosai]EKS10290.1 hypothetical protein LEP1GSC071_3975 [Leptospira santarosai str. JET]MDI7205064.1 hypothetical protein [Leptospira santarosai]MDI7229440.1 hypothetical protein [Leptospira santarosai]
MKKIIPFLILSCQFLLAKEIKIDSLSGEKILKLSASEVLTELKTMERDLRKLDSTQIEYLDRLKESLTFRTEESIENYKKNHEDDYHYYEPAASYMYKRYSSHVNMIQRGAKKIEVLKHLKKIYKWNLLEGEDDLDPVVIPVLSKKTVYKKHFYTEYTKYLYHKVHCKTTFHEAVGEDCGPWPEYKKELNRMLKKYKINNTFPFASHCECFGC